MGTAVIALHLLLTALQITFSHVPTDVVLCPYMLILLRYLPIVHKLFSMQHLLWSCVWLLSRTVSVKTFTGSGAGARK